MERRKVLRGLGALGGVGLTALGGCSAVDPGSGGGEGDTVEVLVDNGTDERVLIAVRIEGRDGETLFSHVYDLGPGRMDQTAGDGEVEARPATVRVFTPDGTSESWDYAPDLDVDCDGKDVGIRLRPGPQIESYYVC